MIDSFPIYAIEFAELGTELAVETPDERTSAVVVRKPFIDPEKKVPKQHLAATAKDN
jgi:glycine cleavage system aminomethyltransferase T